MKVSPETTSAAHNQQMPAATTTMTIVEPAPRMWGLFSKFRRQSTTEVKMEMLGSVPTNAVMVESTSAKPATPAVPVTTTTSMKPSLDPPVLKVTPVEAKPAVPISPYGNYPYLYPSTYTPSKN
jgi:hypothetical protein